MIIVQLIGSTEEETGENRQVLLLSEGVLRREVETSYGLWWWIFAWKQEEKRIWG